MKLNLLLLAGVAAVVAISSSCSKQDATDKDGDRAVLRFTAIPDQDTIALKQKYEPIADYLSETLDVPCEYVPAIDYSASIRMFENGDVHLAWFGGLTGVQARHNVPGARAIAQGEEDPEFYSYFIAHKDTGLTLSESFPTEMAGKGFTFGSEQSTSGRLMPEYFIRENTGKSPEEFFGQKPGFSGAHDATIQLVASGQVETGVLNYKVYDEWAQSAEGDTDTCRIIWKTPTYADYNFTAHPELETMFGEGFIDRLQEALVAMPSELTKALPRASLIAADDEDFAMIKKVAEDLGFIR